MKFDFKFRKIREICGENESCPHHVMVMVGSPQLLVSNESVGIKKRQQEPEEEPSEINTKNHLHFVTVAKVQPTLREIVRVEP